MGGLAPAHRVRSGRGVALRLGLCSLLVVVACGVTPNRPSGGWTLTEIQTRAVTGLVPFGDRFVVQVGVSGTNHHSEFYASHDGITWDRIDAPADDPVALAAGVPGLLVLASRGLAQTSRLVGWRSADGSSWEPIDVSPLEPDSRWRVAGLAWTGHAFVAISMRDVDRIAAFTSPDGMTWTASDLALDGKALEVHALIARDGRVVVVATTAAIAMFLESRDDGQTWRWAEQTSMTGAVRSATFIADRLLVGGCQSGANDRAQAVVWSLAEIDAVPQLAIVDGRRAPDARPSCISALDLRGDTITAIDSTNQAAGVWTSTDGTAWSAYSVYQSGGLVEVPLVANDGTRTIAVGTDLGSLLIPEGLMLVWTAP